MLCGSLCFVLLALELYQLSSFCNKCYKVFIVSAAGQLCLMRNIQWALDLSGYAFVSRSGIYDDTNRPQELAETLLCAETTKLQSPMVKIQDKGFVW